MSRTRLSSKILITPIECLEIKITTKRGCSRLPIRKDDLNISRELFNKFLADNLIEDEPYEIEDEIKSIYFDLSILNKDNFYKCYKMENIPPRVLDNEFYKSILD